MKATAFVLLVTVCAIECRKVVPINKNANIDFINMEIGGGARPAAPAPVPAKPQSPQPQSPKPQSPQPQSPKPLSPQLQSPQSPTNNQPKTPVPVVTTAKPVIVPVPTVPPPKEIKPTVPKPVQPVNQDLEWKPLPQKPTTPGYGSVKQLVTFYDSKGKASVIRPYSYADAVKKPQ